MKLLCLILRDEVMPSTVNRELEFRRPLFNLAKRRKKFYGDNPVSQAGLIKVSNQKERILSYGGSR